MLFIAHKPTHVLLTKDEHIVIVNKSQIYFTSLTFIEEYLTAPLSHAEPDMLEYSP